MRITIESTSQVVTIVERGVEVPARIWEGETDSGIKVLVMVTRISPTAPDADHSQFETELKEQRAPSAAAKSIPLRMIL